MFSSPVQFHLIYLHSRKYFDRDYAYLTSLSVCFFVHVGLLKVWNKILGQNVLIFI